MRTSVVALVKFKSAFAVMMTFFDEDDTVTLSPTIALVPVVVNKMPLEPAVMETFAAVEATIPFWAVNVYTSPELTV